MEQQHNCQFCGNDNASLCHYCRLVSLCRAHFHLHYNEAEKLCYPVKLIAKEGVGRCLVAARKIKAGELILTDISAASGPSKSGLKTESCTQCYANSLYKCKCGLNVCRNCLKNHYKLVKLAINFVHKPAAR